MNVTFKPGPVARRRRKAETRRRSRLPCRNKKSRR